MGKVILIHANCRNPGAKGDFAFAGNMAKDLIDELDKRGISDIDVILVSAMDGIPRFKSMYGDPVDGRLFIGGTSVGLSSLETFDAVENAVIAFIDANRCKHSTAELIKRVLSPDSKFLFVGNVNQRAFSDLLMQTLYRMQLKRDQPGLYEAFDGRDMLIGSAGFGSERLGIPTISKAADLPALSSTDQAKLPGGSYGFMYLAAVNPFKDYKLIAQYIKLSRQDKYILVGEFGDKKSEIQHAYEHDLTLLTSKPLPPIEYLQSLPNGLMRQAVAYSTSSLVLSTGVTSTLEAMRDRKLPYYQNIDNNQQFVAAYLIAVKSIIANDSSLFGALPHMITELSDLLFADKPLNRNDVERTDTLLKLDSINSRLVDVNQVILDKASGKIAANLLDFLGSSRKTKSSAQLASVCSSLRKKGEANSPVHDQALRRAAAWGRLFELKVLVKSMSISEMEKADPTYGRAALHWAVSSKNFDCARALVKAGVSLDLRDKGGQTALHKAVKNRDRAMIKMLIEAGAAIDIPDNNKISPQDCAPDSRTLLFINDCHGQLHRSDLNSTDSVLIYRS